MSKPAVPRKQITGKDLTGNRGRSNPGNYASLPTRNLQVYEHAHDHVGGAADFDLSMEDDPTPPIENDLVTFFNSRQDLEYNLPSTRKRRF